MKKNRPTHIEISFIDKDGRRLSHSVNFTDWRNLIEDIDKMDVDLVEELSTFVKFESKHLFKNSDLHLEWGIVYEEGRAFGNEDQFDQKMHIHYSDDPICEIEHSHGVFLAGPTPRTSDVESWRPKAIKILEELGYDGFVWVPEYKNGFDKAERVDYLSQVEWEKWGLKNATKIVFWVPRDLKDMPAFTTNTEFGRYVDSGRVVYGRPNDAVKCDYLDWMYNDATGKIHHDMLIDTLSEAIR